MRYLIGESKTLAQDQLYGLIQYPLTDYITLGGMGLYSISDQSAALIPMVNYSMFENVDIAIMFNFYTGEKGTAFSKKLGAGGLARAVVYF
jgi:hypothetical protein